jgi:low temperature requirement protein LtrA
MNHLKRTFRSWWKTPRRLLDREIDRRVTFLELFYDLVYVVLIAELAHALSKNIDLLGIGSFVFLFVIVWWAWINGTLYHDLHGSNDIRTRVMTFAQMFCVAAMAVFAHNALGEGSVGFALSFAAMQLTLTFLWWRTGVHDPLHRPLSRPYSLVCLITSLLFISSVFVATPGRFYMWGLSLLLSLILPLYLLTLGRRDPEIQAEIDRSASVTSSGAERFGLFTIIVLGEVIVGVVQGVAGQHHMNWLVGGTAALGMLIAIGIWWVYFDFVSHRIPINNKIATYGWMYLHLPMTIGIASVGAAVLNVVEQSGEQLPTEVAWLLEGALAVALVSIALLMLTIKVPEHYQKYYRRGSMITLSSGIIIVALGLLELDIIPLLVVMCLLMFAPVLYGFKVWVKAMRAEEITLT